MTWANRPRSPFGSLAAIRSGSGPAILLLHGVGLRAEAWAAQIDALSRDHTVIAPDMPGHGESTQLAPGPALSGYTDRIAAALDGPVGVAGHSMGAMIALDLAIRFPGLVTRVAALNAVFRRSAQAAAVVRARAAALDGQTPADPDGPLARWFGDRSSPEATACRTWLEEVDPQGYRDAYTVFATEDGPPETGLSALTCPALFFTGADEPNSTPAMSQAMARRVPGGRAEVLDGAAHMMPMTHPARVSAVLGDFFAARPAGAGSINPTGNRT